METGNLQNRRRASCETLATVLSAAGWCIIGGITIGFSIGGLQFARGMAPETAGMKSFIPVFISGILKPVLFAVLLIGVGGLVRLGIRILDTVESTANKVTPPELREARADKTE